MTGTASPLHPLSHLSRQLKIDLRVKRDDLLPMTGGGNKVRKLARILAQPQSSSVTALITTGGTQSNHARVVALSAAERGLHCHLVLHGDDEVKTSPEGNLLLMKLSGAVINIVSADLVAGGMATAEEEFRERGEVPLVVPGGGHTLAGALAYVDAIEEIQTQLNKWIPDLIVLASGTGATQAGIVVGCSAARWPTRVIGISVARPAARGAEVVSETCRQLRVHLDCRGSPAGVDFRDDWICGGYEHADGRVFSAIATAAASDGLILDPTYTGKAFAALLDLVATGEIARGERVLFWHTGGLLNLLSSDSREVISS